MNLYTRFDGWRNFLKTVEMTSEEMNVKGLNIILMNDGTTKKVVVR